MLGDLTAAFGLTVLCLAPILLVSLVFPPLLMRFTRPAPSPDLPKADKPSKRGPIGVTVAFARFYFLSLVVLVTLTVVFWWMLLLFSPTDAVVDFAEQRLPAERDAIENAVEPAEEREIEIGD